MLLRREGWTLNHKRVCRLYRMEGLAIRRQSPERRVAGKIRGGRKAAGAPNLCWAMVFVHDQLVDGQRFKSLTVLDTFSRICPVPGIGIGYRGSDVVEALEQATRQYGKPH